MATPQGSSAITINQLTALRHETLKDSHHYRSVIPAILPFISPGNPVDVKRFGADFLAEAFSSPQLSVEEKEKIALMVVDLLRQYLDVEEDAAVIKSVVQASTSIYPLIFKHTIYSPTDNTTWMHMAAIKSNILRRMDSAPSGVKICCVKFIQRVVQVQTPGQIADPRRPEQNEVSLALVPNTHPLIAPITLEPEASGLLDRLLSVFQEQQSDALLVTATMNCVGILLKTRPAISNRILNAVLTFNPFKLADSPLNPRTRVMMKSIERTVRAFLTNLIKRAPNHQMQPRIQGYLDQMQQRRAEMFDESRKRPAPAEPTDGLDNAKRQRLDANLSTSTTPMAHFGQGPPPGPIPLSQLFTLTDNSSQIIDISQFNLPPQLIHQIVAGLISRTDRARLDAAVNTVRARWLSVVQAAQPQAPVPPGPPAHPIAPTDDAMNQMNNLPPPDLPAPDMPAELNLGPLEIPQPPPLAPAQVAAYGKATIDRALGTVLSRESTVPVKKTSGFNRLAANAGDRDAAVTMLIRLATRPTAGLAPPHDPSVKEEDDSREAYSMAGSIRHGLLTFVLTDFRKRIETAIQWLCEEWYSETLAAQSAPLQNGDSANINQTPTYTHWTLRLLDGLLPYLDAKDKQLLRLLSEIPQLSPPMIDRVKKLAQDPERVPLATMALYYLILMRPPVKEMCLDAVQDMFETNPLAKARTKDVLKKFRPDALPEESAPAPVKTEAVVKPEGGGPPLATPEQKVAS